MSYCEDHYQALNLTGNKVINLSIHLSIRPFTQVDMYLGARIQCRPEKKFLNSLWKTKFDSKEDRFSPI